MKESVERTLTLDEEWVESWCELTGSDVTGFDTFGEDTVPQAALLGVLPGLMQSVTDDEAIITGITAARFRDPVLMGETVDVTVEFIEETENFLVFDFAARVPERGSLSMTGSLTVTFQ